MDTHDRTEASTTRSNRATKALGIVLAAITLVVVLSWAVSVLFELAVAKSLAVVILALFLIVIGLILAGVT
jgi:hypothetical protein